MAQFRFNTISRNDIENSVGGALMIRGIDYGGPHNLLITGPPGSGKTTVSLMRAERLIAEGKSILLITYQDLLRKSLINIASDRLAPSIHKFLKWYISTFHKFLDKDHDETQILQAMTDWKGVDEIIIDEGQDFEIKVFKSLIEKCRHFTVGADNAQKLHDKGIESDEIKEVLRSKGVNVLPISLLYNYRNTFEIYDFARQFLPHNQYANNKLALDKIPKGKGEKPILFIIPDRATLEAQLKILLENAGERNIAVLVYHIDDVIFYANLIQSMGIRCSSHHSNDHVSTKIENVLVTTYKSAKGLEFQVVIMPEMEYARTRYYQTGEHYFVACTRAKESLFLLSLNGIPDCIKEFNSETYSLIKSKKMLAPPKVAFGVDDEITDLPF